MGEGASSEEGTKGSPLSPTLGGLFLLLCALILGTPLALFAAGVREQGFEARRLAPMPEAFIGGFRAPALPGERMDAYLRDHLPFRYALTRLYNGTRFRLLGESPVADVVVGNDGWLFLSEVLVDRALHPKGKPARVAPVYDAAARAAAAREIGFGIFLSPNKASMYPEQLPARWQQRREAKIVPWQRQLEQLADRRAYLPNLWRRLRAERDAGLPREPSGDARIDERLATLFRPRDRHWHWETGRIQAEEILHTLGLRVDREAWPRLGPYVLQNSELASRFLLFELPEPYASLEGRPALQSQVRRESGVVLEVHLNEQAVNPERVLVIHDSFIEKSLPFLQASIRELVLVHWIAWRKAPGMVEPWIDRVDAIALQSVADHRGFHTEGIEELTAALTALR